MAYTAWSVVFGEQPTAAKWNQLGANDAGFRDGSNFSLNNNVIPANALSASAIFLGKTSTLATVNLNTSYADLITLTVTVPAGARNLLLIVNCPQVQGSAGTERAELRFLEGATILQRYYTGFKNPGLGTTFACIVPSPSAGSHTYKFNGKMDIGTVGLIYADATGSTFEMQALLM